MVRLTPGVQPGGINAARLAKTSRRAAILALIGFLLLASLLASNAWQLHGLQALVEQRRHQVDELEQTIVDLDNQIDTLRYSPTDKLLVRASAQAIPEILEEGRQVYDFTIWIDLSSFRRKTLSSVTYRVSDGTAPFDERVSANAINGFSISYRGTDCLRQVSLDVTFEDGSEQIVTFDMCAQLGW